MRHTYLSKFYWKIKQRRGAKKAVIALARKILVILYHMLKSDSLYNEERFEVAKQKQEIFKIKKIQLEAKKLGFTLTPAVPAA
jgi:hypothetical protein